ncbi:MAG TPA: antibiotic biosynthesis monooxygenase [Rhizomicrobium sp.]|nr:antibiotic biosynthesis monooxygenase [Rhizomicrobium sp.]
MIIREWRGRGDAARPDAYPAHFRTHVVPGLEKLPGFRGATLMRRALGHRLEFVVLSRWETLESVQAFTGPDVSKSIVEPGGVAALLEFDATAQHYEVIESV